MPLGLGVTAEAQRNKAAGRFADPNLTLQGVTRGGLGVAVVVLGVGWQWRRRWW